MSDVLPPEVQAPPTASADVAKLLFSIFVFIADAGKSITAYDVQRFDRALKDTAWARSSGLEAALPQLRVEYLTYWAEHQRAPEALHSGTLAQTLANVLATCTSDQRGHLREALKAFVTRVGYGGAFTISGLGLGSSTRAKVQARRQVEAMLELAPAVLDKIARSGGANGPVVPGSTMLWPAAALPLATEHRWSGGRTRVRCIGVVDETHDVKTFTFEAVPAVLFHYLPGQFVTLELPIGPDTVRRSYTISSSPSRPFCLSITVKRVPEGLASNWLHDSMARGDELWLSGPHGRFSCLLHPAEKLLFIAGGSGVTPIASMLRWIADTGSLADIVFINNVRLPQDIIFERELHDLAARQSERFRLAIITSRAPRGSAWSGMTGRIDGRVIQMIAPDFAEREVFVCGPGSYMDSLKATLEGLGHPPDRFHHESFGAPPPRETATDVRETAARSLDRRQVTFPSVAAGQRSPKRATSVAARSGGSFGVTLRRSQQALSCSVDESILEAAERHGVSIDTACRAGACGSCRVLKIEGEVEMPNQTALQAHELDAGYVLTCIGRPRSDLILDA